MLLIRTRRATPLARHSLLLEQALGIFPKLILIMLLMMYAANVQVVSQPLQCTPICQRSHITLFEEIFTLREGTSDLRNGPRLRLLTFVELYLIPGILVEAVTTEQVRASRDDRLDHHEAAQGTDEGSICHFKLFWHRPPLPHAVKNNGGPTASLPGWSLCILQLRNLCFWSGYWPTFVAERWVPRLRLRRILCWCWPRALSAPSRGLWCLGRCIRLRRDCADNWHRPCFGSSCLLGLRFSLCSRDEGCRSPLQVEEGNVHLLLVHANPNSASDFVGSLAHTKVSHQFVADRLWIRHVVLFQSQPERLAFLGTNPLAGFNQASAPSSCEKVVGQVNLLYGRFPAKHFGEALCA
mmetsp:Transcript_71236/g.170119  ORF Transcript_71236/g.170119 Transcript_71236/m.170119 type:complete len:353 (-) Transcript_71236:323-1381(-)